MICAPVLLACCALVLVAPVRSATILFDESHGQRFLIDGIGLLHLSALADVMRERGLEVQSTRDTLGPETLAGVEALVISGAFQPLTREEIAAVMEFLQSGGRLVVMLHIGPPVVALLHQLGVAISNGVIQEQEAVLDQPIDFRVTRLERHLLTRDLESFALYGAWALLPEGEQTRSVARTSSHAWVDLNGDRRLSDEDAMQSFDVVVVGEHGEGQFVVFADDAMFQNRFIKDENRRLAENLSRWLEP